MNAHYNAMRLSVLLIVATSLVSNAQEATTPDALHLVITKGLGFLAKEGDTWIEEKSCNGCHHMAQLLWSHREAKRRGFAIAQAKLDEWIEWANPKSGGGEQSALMLLALPEKPVPEATKSILKEQKPDGSWNPAGQFTGGQRRGEADVKGSSIRLFLLGLAASDVGPQVLEERRKKAEPWLEKMDPPKAVETLMFRALYARRFGKPEEVDALRADLLKLQHADGGWAFTMGEAKSDAFGTGQALYMLGQLPGADAAGAIERGQQWLIKAQRDDGGWTPDLTLYSKQDRTGTDPKKVASLKNATGIYTFWGSAWATIGLLQGVPLKDDAPKVSEVAAP